MTKSPICQRSAAARVFTVDISAKPFDPEDAHREFRESLPDCGAITAFTGLVRAQDGVTELSLSHYPGMTEREIENFMNEAKTRWPLTGLCVIHRVGDMVPGEPIVFVAAAAAHRRESFKAADFMMDYLKSEAPFWKREHCGDKAQWIEPRTQDIDDKKRWIR